MCSNCVGKGFMDSPLMIVLLRSKYSSFGEESSVVLLESRNLLRSKGGFFGEGREENIHQPAMRVNVCSDSKVNSVW